MKLDSSFCLFVAFFFQCLDKHLTQLLRRHDLVPLTGGVKFRVAVAPAVIFFFTDLPRFQLGGNRAPRGKHPVKRCCVASFVNVDAQMHRADTLAHCTR